MGSDLCCLRRFVCQPCSPWSCRWLLMLRWRMWDLLVSLRFGSDRCMGAQVTGRDQNWMPSLPWTKPEAHEQTMLTSDA